MFEGFTLTTIDTGEATIRLRHGGSGPPLLMMHGNPQTHVMWHKIAPRLAEEFTLVLPDIRGYGESSKPGYTDDHEPYSKRNMAKDQVEVMRQLGFDQYFVAGHDRGGRVAYRMALDHPDKVLKLATLDMVPTYDSYKMSDWQHAYRSWHWYFLCQPADFPERAIGKAPEVFFERRPTNIWTPEAREDYWRCYNNPDTIRAICEDYRAGITVDFRHDEEDLGKKKITCPMLSLWGSKPYAGQPDADFVGIWSKWATNVRGQPIDSGHFLAEDNPDDTYAALRAFFAE